MSNKTTLNKEGKFENYAKRCLWVALIISVIATILFLTNRPFSFFSTIDNSLFSNYGDFIGGVVGTIVSLVSFLLLYETLNEQRRQFYLQQKETATALQTQKGLFQKQSEDNIFFKVLEKQHNRIVSTSVVIEKESFVGFEIFKGLSVNISARITRESIILARHLICDAPDQIGSLYLQKIFFSKQHLVFDNFNEFNASFMNNILPLQWNERWEYIKVFFDSVGHESQQSKEALLSVGHTNFYKVSFNKRHDIYTQMFSNLLSDFGCFLDSYFKEIEYVTQFIDNSLNKADYNLYYLSQITIYEYVLILYYLLSGTASKRFFNYAISSNLINNLCNCRFELFDSPTIEEIAAEIHNIESINGYSNA